MRAYFDLIFDLLRLSILTFCDVILSLIKKFSKKDETYFYGKYAFVTGACGGVGTELCKKLIELG